MVLTGSRDNNNEEDSILRLIFLKLTLHYFRTPQLRPSYVVGKVAWSKYICFEMIYFIPNIKILF